MSFISASQHFVDGVFDFGNLEWLPGDAVEAFRRNQILVAEDCLELARIHFGHKHFVKLAEQVAKVARQRPEMAEVNVAHGEAAGADILDGSADRPVRRSPTDDGQLTESPPCSTPCCGISVATRSIFFFPDHRHLCDGCQGHKRYGRNRMTSPDRRSDVPYPAYPAFTQGRARSCHRA